MNVAHYANLVVPKFRLRYPKLREVIVTEIVEDVFSGTIVVVRSSETVPHEEMVFVTSAGKVEIFSTTEDLASFLDRQSKRTLLDRFFTKPVLSGALFLGLLVVLALIGFKNEQYNQNVVTILGSVVSVAAGYFFGASQKK